MDTIETSTQLTVPLARWVLQIYLYLYYGETYLLCVTFYHTLRSAQVSQRCTTLTGKGQLCLSSNLDTTRHGKNGKEGNEEKEKEKEFYSI